MNNYQIYALKAHPSYNDSIIKSMTANGEGRFGWSYDQNADLSILKQRIESQGVKLLTEPERDCYQPFLLDLKADDYVIYVNLPTWGECTLAKVTGPYFWRFDDKDFNHRFSVDRSSVKSFNRNDVAVHPFLKARLKLQGRYWRIYDLRSEFEQLLVALAAGKKEVAEPRRSNLKWLEQELIPHLVSVTKSIQRTHPNYDLEYFLLDIFKRVPGISAERRGGPADHGADLLLRFDAGMPLPGLRQQVTCVVQVKSFTGRQSDLQAVEDIRRALQKYSADSGLIVTTADEISDEVMGAIDKLREDEMKPVALLHGAELATFCLKHGDF